MYETHATSLKYRNEMLCLKKGKNVTNKQTHQLCQILTLCPIRFRLHIYFSSFFFFFKKQNLTNRVIPCATLPPSFPLLLGHGEHDL